MSVPRIAITPGEPAGIGPDLVLQIAQQPWAMELVCFADASMLKQRAKLLGYQVNIQPWQAKQPAQAHKPGTLLVAHHSTATSVQVGQCHHSNSGYVLNTLRSATQACQQDLCQALVTGPVHKGVINDAGIPFTGHTEFFAKLTGTAQVVMMLCSQKLKVALATTHIPLQQVPQHLTQAHLRGVIEITHTDMVKRFGIEKPRITVCGLNPHAGESGHFGDEEIKVISPVIQQLQQQGMELTGPVSADTAFIPNNLDNCDIVVAMYHDQGLPVIKTLDFASSINITLGLPIIRSSVDHGTALDLAGTGKAHHGSFAAAIHWAAHMIKQQAHASISHA